jgi:hypothetical protein
MKVLLLVAGVYGICALSLWPDEASAREAASETDDPPESIPPDFEADEDIVPWSPESPERTVTNWTSLPDPFVIPFVRTVEAEAQLEAHAWSDLQAQSSVLPSQAPVTLACEMTVLDGYLRPVAGESIYMMALTFNPDTTDVTELGRAYTDVTGHAVFYAEVPPDTKRAWCVPDISRRAITGNESFAATASPHPHQVVVTPLPNDTHEVPGRINPAGVCGASTSQCATMDLYLSADGVYDRVVVLAEPFNSAEKRDGPRTAAQMWLEYNGNPRHLGGFDKATLKTFYDRGFDVWVVRQWRTGDNLHEQAAEFAQAIQYAVDYRYNGRGPDGGMVATMGWSLGGLVNRVATARWSWDANWRAALGLQPTVPVRLVIVGEAPLRGAQLNRDLQFRVWENDGAADANLDTCAAQQMLQKAVHEVCGFIGSIYRCGLGHDNVGWNAFYDQGTGFSFRDRFRGLHSCEAGPPVLTQGPNHDGWPPGIKRIAASQGTRTESNRCYGDATGNDLNGDYRDVCPERDAWVPQPGDEWANLRVATSLGSKTIRVYFGSEDLEAGGRHDSIFTVHAKGWAGPFNSIHWSADSHQFASGTFIPLRSALDTTCATCASAMSDTWVHGYNAVHTAVSSRHGSYNMSVVDWLRTHLEGGTPTCQPSAEICGNGVDEDCDGRDAPCKGGPFLYASARDQYLACWGMAGHIASNCDTISDFNDRQFCYGMAWNSQDPCRSMTDRNLQLSCYGMTVAPNYPSNCRDINDLVLQDFCYSVSSWGSWANCSGVSEPATAALCQALTWRNSSYCGSIGDANDRWFCTALASQTNSYCANIEYCDPNQRQTCLSQGGQWDAVSCSCQMGCQSTGCPGGSCGWQTDNCGRSLWCGDCPCQSTGCPGGSCGWQTDNCGTSLWCGDCPCQSTGCPGGSCGWQTDNCGNSLWCGDCACVSEGCPPGSCGWQADNCGNWLWCGDCTDDFCALGEAAGGR